MAQPHPSRKSHGHIASSFSASSLDVVLEAAVMPSLMAESATLTSLSTNSSNSVPIFSLRKPPTFKTVGLGDNLKLFSATSICHSAGEGMKRVIITSPTSPRLRSMLKECLNIDKWVENTRGWKAPGHVPWEKVECPKVHHWIPEGSVLPPDVFFSEVELDSTSENSDYDSIQLSERELFLPDNGSTRGRMQNMDNELAVMMHELDGIRSFFQESLVPPKLSLPSLVVSSSQFTFPLSLTDSSLGLSDTSNIACRRGKAAPPSLPLVKDSKSLQELPYPEIPTAFLGSIICSPQSDNFSVECDVLAGKPTLRFEEMINNLRLQCSTMSLETPAPDVDSFWNSRSFMKSELGVQSTTDLAKIERRKGSLESTFSKNDTSLKKPLYARKIGYTHRPRAPPLCEAHRSIGNNVLTSALQTTNVSQTTNDIKAKLLVQSADESALQLSANQSMGYTAKDAAGASTALRSAMVKNTTSQSSRPVKCVRFISKHQEIPQNEVSKISENPRKKSNNKNNADVPMKQSSTQTPCLQTRKPAPAMVPTMVPKSDPLKTVDIGLTRKLTATLPVGVEVKGASSISSPLRHSVPVKSSDNSNEIFKKHQTNGSVPAPRRSVQSLGRQSLSRIMKAPVFGIKDHGLRRATMSSMSIASELATDENVVRRESPGDYVRKKSLMPVPFRNILTRFK